MQICGSCGNEMQWCNCSTQELIAAAKASSGESFASSTGSLALSTTAQAVTRDFERDGGANTPASECDHDWLCVNQYDLEPEYNREENCFHERFVTIFRCRHCRDTTAEVTKMI